MTTINKENFDLVIEANRTERNYWRDIWRYRELFYVLSWKNIKIRYKQAVFGIAWSVVRPLITMVIFVLVFDKLAKMPSEGMPYPIMVFTALLPWQFFSNAFTESTNSLIGNAQLVSKVYFPRIILPVSAVITSLIDLVISLALLAVLMLVFQFVPSWHIVFLPVFMLMALMTALGPGLWIAALNVKYRDFKFIAPFITQAGLYISPVGFTSSVIPDQYRFLYNINPMVGVIDGFRWCILGQDYPFPTQSLGQSLIIIILILLISIMYFRRAEKKFADVI